MAITTTNRRAGPFLGDGVTTTFPFAFKVFSAADLQVLQQDFAGNITALTLGSDYTVSLNASQDVNPGGSATLTVALPLLYRLVLTTDIPELQQVVLTNLGGFFPDVLNTVHDRLTILIQQLEVELSRTIRFGITDDLDTLSLPSSVQRANSYMYFGSDGGISLVPSAPFPQPVQAVPFAGPLLGTIDGTNRTFTLTAGGVSLASVPSQALVWKNFPLIQNDPNGYAYGPQPGQITFAVAPVVGDSLYAQGLRPLLVTDLPPQYPAGSTLFQGPLIGTKDGVNKVFVFSNGGAAIGQTPISPVVWQNFPVIPGVAYTLGPAAGQVTFTTAPAATDTLFGSGVYTI